VSFLGIISVIAIVGSAGGAGPFPLGGEDSHFHLLELQIFLGVTSFAGVFLSAAIAQNLESKILLRAVVDGSTDAVYVKDRQGRYLLFNSAAARFVGKAATDVIGQAQKMESVGRLAGGVAHDFNNMLGVIIGHAELAMEQAEPESQVHADLQEILKAADRS
jgi:PAS domain-containing protein